MRPVIREARGYPQILLREPPLPQPSGASIIPSSSATASRHGVPPPPDTSVRHGTLPCAGISSVPVPSLHHTKFHPCFRQPDWSRSALGPQNEALELLKKGMKKRKKKKHIQLKKGEKMIHASQAVPWQGDQLIIWWHLHPMACCAVIVYDVEV